MALILRDMKLYEESEKCYLKALEVMDGIDSNINRSYAHLLHLMDDDEKATKYTQFQKDLSPNNTCYWEWFCHGLINKEKENGTDESDRLGDDNEFM